MKTQAAALIAFGLVIGLGCSKTGDDMPFVKCKVDGKEWRASDKNGGWFAQDVKGLSADFRLRDFVIIQGNSWSDEGFANYRTTVTIYIPKPATNGLYRSPNQFSGQFQEIDFLTTNNAGNPGSLEVTYVDSATGRIEGKFSFPTLSIRGTGKTVSITEGQFRF